MLRCYPELKFRRALAAWKGRTWRRLTLGDVRNAETFDTLSVSSEAWFRLHHAVSLHVTAIFKNDETNEKLGSPKLIRTDLIWASGRPPAIGLFKA